MYPQQQHAVPMIQIRLAVKFTSFIIYIIHCVSVISLSVFFRHDDDSVESNVRDVLEEPLGPLVVNGGLSKTTSPGAGGLPDEEATEEFDALNSRCKLVTSEAQALADHFDRIEERVAFAALMHLAAADMPNPQPGEKRKYTSEGNDNLVINPMLGNDRELDGGGSKPPPLPLSPPPSSISPWSQSREVRQDTDTDTTPFPNSMNTGNHFPVSNGIDRLPALSTLPRGDCPPYEAIVNFTRARCKMAVRCVMCGGGAANAGLGAVIPQQNKDVCRTCDKALWVHGATGCHFKWCKGCKCFRSIFAFSEKLVASKCNGCRERGRRSYLQRISGSRAITMTGDCGSGGHSSGGSGVVDGRRGRASHGGLSTSTAAGGMNELRSVPPFKATYTQPSPCLEYDDQQQPPAPLLLLPAPLLPPPQRRQRQQEEEQRQVQEDEEELLQKALCRN